MTYLDILEKWAEYSNYEKNRKQFNLLSVEYEFHKIGEVIELILKDYDSSGLIASIYAKIQFERILKDGSFSAWDIITNPDCYKKELDMYNVFNIPLVANAEKEFIGRLDNIYSNITKGKLLGENPDQSKTIINTMVKVLESMKKCNVDLFAKGGNISNVNNISTKLHIFNTLAECLLAIEKAKDGMYLCFIRAGDSADCYFSFLIKSNGTVLSVNDRQDEAYIGSHGNQRNASWVENKLDNIFPYDFIFEYGNHDYKGYATEYKIDDSKTELYNLGIEVIMPIIVAMILVIMKYSDKDLDMPIHYLDSFLPQNQIQIKKNELMVIENSSLVASHNDVDISFDNDRVISGDYATEFHWKDNEKHYKETGHFCNINQIFVDMYGDDFVYDPTQTFTNSNIACLTNEENNGYVPEFVGTQDRIRLQAYKDIRSQLAAHIQKKIDEEWVAFGKTEAVKEWYKNAIMENKEFIYKLFVEYEKSAKEASKGFHNGLYSDKFKISYSENNEPNISHTQYSIFNAICENYYRGKWLCPETGNHCNVWFSIIPYNWNGIEFLTGKETPKIVKGWKSPSFGHGEYAGNSILDATDAVADITTPFNRRDRLGYGEGYYDFEFSFGFSKRGWNRIKKELLEK